MPRWSRRWLLSAAFVALALLGGSRLLPPASGTSGPGASARLVGRIVDWEGRPVAGARVQFRLALPRRLHPGRFQEQARSGADGWFEAMVPRTPLWLEVERPGFLRRLKPVQAGGPVVIRLSRDDGETVVVHAVGDVMFGRRFYGPDTLGGHQEVPALAPGAGVADHQALLAAVAPLLARADLSVANLETPLIPEPWIDPARPRPARFHPTKDYAFASAPAAAEALRNTGFDVLGLANNHFFDALDGGLASSLNALARAGFRPGEGVFGAGRSWREAWRPARRRIRGQSLALLGCTTIEGRQHPSDYVAASRGGKAGAAPCEARTLAAAIRAARRGGTAVLVMIHGGNEYQRQPTPRVQAMVEVARAAGAAAILNHHPHVVGGFQWQGGTLVADSLGNFLFDQTLWPTFESYLLELHLRRGVVVRALAEPLILHRYRPYALVGGLADFVARGAAGRGPAAAFAESGTVEVDGGRLRRRRTWPLQLRGQPQQGSLFHTSAGVWLERAGGAGQLEGGRDLLWVGDFEDGAVGVEPGAGMLWGLSPPDKALDPQAAATGAWGVRLERSPANRQPVMLSPLHRIPVQPGQRLTLLGWMRGPTTARARLLVGWHAARRGGSQARIERPIPLAGAGRWLPVRWDLTVPPYTVALGLHVVLDPPAWGRSHLDVDGLRLILWEPANGPGGPLLDWYRLKGPVALRLIGEVGPGGEALVAPPAQRLVRAWGAP